jgi:hypothetical protein
MRELTVEVRSARSEQQSTHRATLERLDKLTDSVDKMESGVDREQWMDELRGLIVRRTVTALTLAVMIGGLAVAAIGQFT